MARPPAVMRRASSAERRRASMATTMHCAPYLADAVSITCGSAIAAELKLTLSAPALSRRRTSPSLPTPHTAADGQRDEHLAGHGLDDGQDQVALVAGGGDVQKGKLVGPLGVVARSD